MAKPVINVPGVRTIGGVVMVDPAKINILANYNVRDAFDAKGDAEDASLLQSILANGFQTDKPLVVRRTGTQLDLIAGHRRLAAVMEARTIGADIREVAVILEGAGHTGKARDDVERMADLVLSNSGKPLSPPEKSTVILRLRRYGWNDVTIAERLGLSDKWVRELVKLSDLAPRLRALVKAQVIAPTLAVELTRAHGAEGAADIADKAREAAPKTGARAGKVTGAIVTVVTGKAGKAEAQAARREAGKPAPVTVLPAKGAVPAAVKNVSALSATIAGPFSIGTDMDDAMLFDANGAEVCEFASAEVARAMLMLINQGWQTFHGKSAPTVTPVVPAKTAPVLKSTPVASTPVKVTVEAPAKPATVTPVVIKELASLGAVMAGKAQAAKARTVARKGK